MELKPCPFCNSNNIAAYTASNKTNSMVYCKDCEVKFELNHPYAIRQWNTRVSQWVSVKDSLPKESGYYLCTYHFDGHNFYQDKWFSSLDNSFSTTDCVTHWQPLPEPPYG